jgi:hypothetical protein
MTRAGTDRLVEIFREEADTADGSGQGNAHLLRHLAATMDKMTPAEMTWVEEASDEQLHGFAKAIRLGCPPAEEA